jgi:DEAD/DEAH box helicase domain-containing protein
MSQRNVISATAAVLSATEDMKIIHDPETHAGRDGRFHSLQDSSLCPNIVEYLGQRFPNGLYSHQHDAIENVLAGKNTILATRTSSGKSLIYSLPALHMLCEEPESTALFLFPQKALANDQLMKLREMAAAISCINRVHANNPLLVSRYDGSVDSASRPEIREKVQLMLTNPDMLHFSVLQHHENHWARFFRNLKLVAIDECHEYRGIFGTNVAMILHRLRQICQHYGSNPTFIATSATVSEPQAHMQKLTGLPFECIDASHDGSQQGERKMWMVNGPEHYYDFGRKLALKLAEQGLTVLAFCPSRVAAERMLSRIPRKDEEMSHVRVYRSGLSSKEREAIEAGLRDRSVRVVFSTSALELGIDIGEIDVVVCVGLPHSMMSLWQRVGRSARGGREGAAIFIPADSPIDTYYSNHPEELFSKDHEPLVLNLTNQRLLCQHYACAIQEVAGRTERLNFDALGHEIETIHELRTAGKLDRDEFYRSEPHMEISIRGAGEGSYKLMEGDECIGEIDSFHLLRESCRNAIYRHGGRAFRVKDVIRGRKIVNLRHEWTFNETTPFIQKKIQLRKTLQAADYSQVRLATVRIVATEYLAGLTERDRGGKVVNSWSGNQAMPPHQLPTEGTMLLLKKEFWTSLLAKLNGSETQALEACERLLCGLFPTISGPCDTQDFSSAVDKLPTGELALFLYDAVYDGVGLTFVAFEMMKELIEKALERVSSCDCEEDTGCFSCVANPNKERPASKHDARLILQALQSVLESETARQQTITSDWAGTFEETAAVACTACSSAMKSTDRFCPNCGTKMQA